MMGGSSNNNPLPGMAAPPEENWINVTWMPHASLSQTSHVCLLVRSSHAVLDDSSSIRSNHQPSEWKIRTSVHGMGGIPLVPVTSTTPGAPLVPRRRRTAAALAAAAVVAKPTTTTTTKNNQVTSNDKMHPSVSNASHDCQWDHLVQVPIRWRDLPRDAYLLLELLDHTGIMVGSTKMHFFTKYGRLSTGLTLLELEEMVVEDDENGQSSSVLLDDNNGARRRSPEQPDDDPVWKASMMMDKLESFEASRTGEIHPAAATTDNRKVFGRVQSVPWLDAISKDYCRKVIAEDTTNSNANNQRERYSSRCTDTEGGAPWHLIVELPVFDVAVMHEESIYPVPQQAASGPVSALDLSLYRKSEAIKDATNAIKIATTTTTANPPVTNQSFHPLQLVHYVDYENEMDNPVEDKYRTLAHDLLRGLVDPALKPDREQRDRLASIIASPSHHPTREEKDLLWRFRFSLVDNHRALSKFLLAVDWTVESEVVQAAELLEQWRRLDIPDALKLLGKHVAFQTNLVRQYAIDTLATAPDVELRLYLLQLVQALKYETMPGPDTRSNTGSSSSENNQQSSSRLSPLASFLIGRATGNLQLANYLYWYLKVELQDATYGARYRDVFSALKARLSETPFRVAGSTSKAVHTTVDTNLNESFMSAATGGGDGTKESKSSSFKSIVSSVSSKLGSSLKVSEQHSFEKTKKDGQQRSFWDILVEQDEFVSGLMDIQMQCRDARGKKDAKEAQLQTQLSSEGYDRDRHRDPVPLPSAPHVFVNGVNPGSAKMFKSALYPALVEFFVEATLPMIGEADLGGHSGAGHPAKGGSMGSLDHLSHFKVIVKTGDDLRQDQLVIMLIQLMDGLLKRAALNLCLTPYSIIAMSPTSGLVEFVDGSMPISQILSKYSGSILQYFQDVAPQKGAKYDVRPDVMSSYVRSCAGYCVITFIIGVGDRHLDNILLDSSGHFFHIDFGFIFGRDPKPMPPAFRLTREMVEGMGGLESSEYRQFCSLACQAFNTLRKSAGLILNLLHLMSDAGIEDLSNNPSGDAESVIARVEERFRLELTDEKAERFFLGLINDSLAALAPRVMDVLHSLAVARR